MREFDLNQQKMEMNSFSIYSQHIFSYTKQAKINSDRFRDQPLTPLELAIYWVEYVAENKGAPHLRSVAVDLTFYKLYNLDVWAFISIVILLLLFMMVKTIKWITSFLFRTIRMEKMKIL